MYDPEYQLPCGRNYAEHKRLIRQMGKGVVLPNPIARAMVEIAVTVAVSSLRLSKVDVLAFCGRKPLETWSVPFPAECANGRATA